VGDLLEHCRGRAARRSPPPLLLRLAELIPNLKGFRAAPRGVRASKRVSEPVEFARRPCKPHPCVSLHRPCPFVRYGVTRGSECLYLWGLCEWRHSTSNLAGRGKGGRCASKAVSSRVRYASRRLRSPFGERLGGGSRPVAKNKHRVAVLRKRSRGVAERRVLLQRGPAMDEFGRRTTGWTDPPRQQTRLRRELPPGGAQRREDLPRWARWSSPVSGM
jgi:hypothetical protein